MDTLPPTTLYKRHRFQAEIISHCVWLYFRFCLSYRDVEELMAERGVILTYEAVRYCGRGSCVTTVLEVVSSLYDRLSDRRVIE
jgi:transposase-like protein